MIIRKAVLFSVLVIALSFPNSYADLKKESRSAQGASILKEIEPNFTSSPIFLNPDENFKATNKAKLLEAIGYFEEDLKRNPNNGNLLYLLGVSYSFGHDLNIPGAWQKSVKHLNQAIQIDPKDAKSHMVLGKNYMDAGKFDQSYQEYERVNEIIPNGFALRNMAFVRMAQKKTGEAQILLEKYIQYNSQDEDAPKILIALKEGKFEVEAGFPKHDKR